MTSPPAHPRLPDDKVKGFLCFPADAQWRTQEFCSVGEGRGEGGVEQIQLRTEDRKNGDLGAVAP